MTEVSKEFYSNCFIVALAAKLRHPFKVKLYYCPSRYVRGHYQSFHFMWSDGVHDYDFSDHDGDENSIQPWYRYIIFKGTIRQFKLGFAKRYSDYRKGRTATYE